MTQTLEFAAPSTPTVGSRVRTPDAPQYGFSDAYEPYTPRKSTRIAQRASNATPSPKVPSRQYSQAQKSIGSPKRQLKELTVADMDAPELTPKKKRVPAIETSRRASGTLTASSTATAAVALGLAGKRETLSARVTTASSASVGTLITPAKTPQKPPTRKTKVKVSSFARTLFRSDEDSMPTPRKARSSPPQYTLDSIFQEESFESIPIYTDSHERIPEVDRSEENPFLVDESAAPAPVQPRRSKRQMVTIPGEGKISVEEAIKRNDGMLITFRGKKEFRKFTDEDREDAGLESAVESRTRHAFTRAAVKPRLLFPVPKKNVPEVSIEDEEAATDIEDHVLASMDSKAKSETTTEKTPDTPKAKAREVPVEPVAPASPPATTRTTRFTNKTASASPASSKKGTPGAKVGSGAKISPFDSWTRTKVNPAATNSLKRAGSPMPTKSSKRSRV